MSSMTERQEPESWPLSPEQRAILASATGNGEDTFRVASEQVRTLFVGIEGEIDKARLEASLECLRQQHESLRAALCAVPGYRGLRHQLSPDIPPLTWWHGDLRGSDDIDARLEACVDALVSEPLAIDRGELLRPALWCIGESRWVLALAVSALVADRQSLQTLFVDWRKAYDEGEGAWQDSPVLQYSQFVEWRASLAEDEGAREEQEYWRHHERQAESAATLHLPTRKMGQFVEPDHARVMCELAPELIERIERFAEEREVSAEVVMQAIWWALLARIGDNRRFVAGWQHDCRTDYEVMEGAVGIFDKVLPLLVDLEPETRIADWICSLGQQLETHTQVQEYWPVEAPSDDRHLVAGFTYAVGLERTGNGSVWGLRELPGSIAPFELAMQIVHGERGGHVSLYFDPSRYSQATAESLLDQYLPLLEAALDDPAAVISSVPLATLAQQEALLSGDSGSVDVGACSVAERIAEWAGVTPDAPAIEEGECTLSYAQLEARVQDMALWLQGQGVNAGDHVALNLPRSTELVVMLLAIWRVGAAYLPLDPEWPVARRQRILEDARPVLIVSADDAPGNAASATLPGMRNVMPQGGGDATDAAFSWPPASLRDVAYLLYTSGSTGAPKGVVIEHGQLLNYVAGASRVMKLSGYRRWALTGSVATDLGNTALFGALFNGACLVIAKPDDMQDGEHFARFMSAAGIDALKIVPSHLEALLECDAPVLPRALILGGEAASPSLLSTITGLSSECEIYNHYGPTEATVGVMVHRVSPEHDTSNPLPLTRVLPNCRCLVLDEALCPVPIGATGELYLGGTQLARGYLDSQDDASFVEDPLRPGERLYRTGDLACVLPEGGVRLMGRVDDQVKLRGFRIEPAEIESALRTQPGIRQCMVRPIGSGGDAQELVAFLVAGPNVVSVEGQTRLREQLAALLPEFMCPARFIQVEAFPRLGNGKVDISALAALAEGTGEQKPLTEPRDAVEAALCHAMAELLGRDAIGIDEDFFELGGHSLLVIKLVARIRKQFGVEIAPGMVFDHPTAAALGQVLREGEPDIEMRERAELGTT
ncbi:non-ribosomal peptide synthetase [Halomonas elongata]|uniref:non-ribosomal peptide synthetase n=1 Tax=Halomonas elongata TaxID=2746 RepID=UPI0038D4E2E5